MFPFSVLKALHRKAGRLRRPARLGLAALALALAGCGGDDPSSAGGPLISIVEAKPAGFVARTEPIEFTLSAEVGPVSLDHAVAIAPPMALDVRWAAPDRIVAVPREPFKPNTKYVVRLLPRALGTGKQLARASPLEFHTRLFTVDLVDHDGLADGTDTPRPISNVRLAFTHPVRVDDLERYVVLRNDAASRVDLPFRVTTEGQCRRCELALESGHDVVNVEIFPELTPAVGGVSLEKRVQHRLDRNQPVPLRVIDVRPQQRGGRLGLRIETTRDLPPSVPAGLLRVVPPVGHFLRADGRALVVQGSFQPGNDYTVSISSMVAREGVPLADEFEQSVTMPSLHPELTIKNDGLVLSPTESEPIVVNTVGVQRLSLRAFSVPIDNLVHVLDRLNRMADHRDDPGLGAANTPQWSSLGRWNDLPGTDVDGDGDGPTRTVVRLPSDRRPGLRLLEIRSVSKPWLVDQRWIQAGWVLSAKQGVQQTRVQVFSAAERRPIRGARVRLRTESNHSIGPVPTDAQGVALLDNAVDDPVELVIATKGGETALLDLTSNATRDDPGPLNGVGPTEAFVLPAQDRFRPGDPLPLLLVVRAAGLEPVEGGLAVSARLRGPNGRVWLEDDAKLWRAGGLRLDLVWPRRAPYGPYTIEAVSDDQVIGEAKVFLQAQQTVDGQPAATPLVPTSTGSARLSWTPERPRPGETLQVRWLAPAPGWVTISLESTQVWAEVRRKVGQGPATFSLTVPRQANPGAHLVVTFEPLGDGAAMGDRVWLEIGRRRPLQVRLELPDGPHRSGDKVVARLRVRGRVDGLHAVVRVAAPETLDPALAGQRDAFQFFHRYRPPSWRTYVTSGRFERGPLDRWQAPVPRPAPTLGRRLSFMSEPTRFGSRREKKISLTLPRRQGKLRVQATVWTETRLGTAEAELEVRDPLAISAASPPMLTEGDSIELPVTVFSGLPESAPLQVVAATVGGLEVVGSAGQSFELPPGGQVDGRVRVAASRSGSVTLKAGTESQSVQWKRRLRVRAAGPPQIVGIAGQSALKAPAATLAWPALAGRSRVIIGTTPLYQLGAAMTRLARADRDDLETVSARALVRQLVPDLTRPEGGSMPAVPGTWSSSLDAVDRCMGPDGPRAWPEGPPANVGSIVLAGHAIVRAARRGRASDNFERWVNAVRSVTRSGATDPRTVAYGQWVLALARRPDEAMLLQLHSQWVNRPPDLATGVGLGAALSLSGRRRLAAPLLKFTDSAALEPSDAAFVLAALSDADPDHPVLPELIAQVVNVLSGSSQFGLRTDALALTGLAGLASGNDLKQPYWGTLTLGDQQLRRLKGPGRVVVGDFDDATRTKGDLVLKVTGGARLFASLVVEGAPPTPEDGVVKVDLRLLDGEGKPLTTATVNDPVTMSVSVGPIGIDVPDLRIAVPVPSGLTVTRVQPPNPQTRVAREPGLTSFDLPVSTGAAMQVKLHTTATFAGDFALGPVVVSSALQPSQWGISESKRLVVSQPP